MAPALAESPITASWTEPNPAFKGKKRELVAQDYVYSLKRFFDPALKSPSFSGIKDEGLVGLNALRDFFGGKRITHVDVDGGNATGEIQQALRHP